MRSISSNEVIFDSILYSITNELIENCEILCNAEGDEDLYYSKERKEICFLIICNCYIQAKRLPYLFDSKKKKITVIGIMVLFLSILSLSRTLKTEREPYRFPVDLVEVLWSNQTEVMLHDTMKTVIVS